MSMKGRHTADQVIVHIILIGIAFYTLAPIMLLYIFVQKYIVAGVADGAVKQ